MLQSLPKVLPINELKNTAQISKTCNESDVPIVITKNGYSDMVLMSIKLYEDTVAKVQAAAHINEALEQYEKTGKTVNAEDTFAQLREKYGAKT